MMISIMAIAALCIINAMLTGCKIDSEIIINVMIYLTLLVATCVCVCVSKQVADTLRRTIRTPIRIKDSFNTTTRTGLPDMKVITRHFFVARK